MLYFIFGITAYFLLGIILVLWDFRRLWRKSDSETSAFIKAPTFVSDWVITSAVVFVILWPIELIKKFLR